MTVQKGSPQDTYYNQPGYQKDKEAIQKKKEAAESTTTTTEVETEVAKDVGDVYLLFSYQEFLEVIQKLGKYVSRYKSDIDKFLAQSKVAGLLPEGTKSDYLDLAMQGLQKFCAALEKYILLFGVKSSDYSKVICEVVLKKDGVEPFTLSFQDPATKEQKSAEIQGVVAWKWEWRSITIPGEPTATIMAENMNTQAVDVYGASASDIYDAVKEMKDELSSYTVRNYLSWYASLRDNIVNNEQNQKTTDWQKFSTVYHRPAISVRYRNKNEYDTKTKKTETEKSKDNQAVLDPETKLQVQEKVKGERDTSLSTDRITQAQKTSDNDFVNLLQKIDFQALLLQAQQCYTQYTGRPAPQPPTLDDALPGGVIAQAEAAATQIVREIAPARAMSAYSAPTMKMPDKTPVHDPSGGMSATLQSSLNSLVKSSIIDAVKKSLDPGRFDCSTLKQVFSGELLNQIKDLLQEIKNIVQNMSLANLLDKLSKLFGKDVCMTVEAVMYVIDRMPDHFAPDTIVAIFSGAAADQDLLVLRDLLAQGMYTTSQCAVPQDVEVARIVFADIGATPAVKLVIPQIQDVWEAGNTDDYIAAQPLCVDVYAVLWAWLQAQGFSEDLIACMLTKDKNHKLGNLATLGEFLQLSGPMTPEVSEVEIMLRDPSYKDMLRQIYDAALQQAYKQLRGIHSNFSEIMLGGTMTDVVGPVDISGNAGLSSTQAAQMQESYLAATGYPANQVVSQPAATGSYTTLARFFEVIAGATTSIWREQVRVTAGATGSATGEPRDRIIMDFADTIRNESAVTESLHSMGILYRQQEIDNTQKNTLKLYGRRTNLRPGQETNEAYEREEVFSSDDVVGADTIRVVSEHRSFPVVWPAHPLHTPASQMFARFMDSAVPRDFPYDLRSDLHTYFRDVYYHDIIARTARDVLGDPTNSWADPTVMMYTDEAGTTTYNYTPDTLSGLEIFGQLLSSADKITCISNNLDIFNYDKFRDPVIAEFCARMKNMDEVLPEEQLVQIGMALLVIRAIISETILENLHNVGRFQVEPDVFAVAETARRVMEDPNIAVATMYLAMIYGADESSIVSVISEIYASISKQMGILLGGTRPGFYGVVLPASDFVNNANLGAISEAVTRSTLASHGLDTETSQSLRFFFRLWGRQEGQQKQYFTNFGDYRFKSGMSGPDWATAGAYAEVGLDYCHELIGGYTGEVISDVAVLPAEDFPVGMEVVDVYNLLLVKVPENDEFAVFAKYVLGLPYAASAAAQFLRLTSRYYLPYDKFETANAAVIAGIQEIASAALAVVQDGGGTQEVIPPFATTNVGSDTFGLLRSAFAKTSIEKQIASMALQAPKLIFKSLVEQLDPNIRTARMIVDTARIAGRKIPMPVASMALMPVNVFSPPIGYGPPITPAGWAYLAMSLVDQRWDQNRPMKPYDEVLRELESDEIVEDTEYAAIDAVYNIARICEESQGMEYERQPAQQPSQPAEEEEPCPSTSRI